MPNNSPNRIKRNQGGFMPIDTLNSDEVPKFPFIPPGDQGNQINKTYNVTAMVNQREPPRTHASPHKSSQPTTSADSVPIYEQQFPQERDSVHQSKTLFIAKDNRPKFKDPFLPLMDRTNQPEFGKASPIGQSTQQKTDTTKSKAFIQPRPNQPRFEHHETRPSVQSQQQPPPSFGQPGLSNGSTSANLSQAWSAQHHNQPPRSQISQPWPSNPYGNFNKNAAYQRPVFHVPGQPPPALQQRYASNQSNPPYIKPATSIPSQYPQVQPPSRPVFSTNSSFTPVNGWDLKKAGWEQVGKLPEGFDPRVSELPDGFNLNAGIRSEYDPSNFVDPSQASENIKALLEGAFEEDEDDKPKSRLRKRKSKKTEIEKSAVDELAEKAAGLKVDDKKQDEVEDEEDEDEGTVEGLRVKLLPHQIDGLNWMLDKEAGKVKKNGVLPKGGILADDMGLGKTIQALGLILSNPRPSKQEAEKLAQKNPKQKIPESAGKGTLVVAPLALIKQWESEFNEKVSPESKLKILVHHGASRTKSYEDLKKYDVVVTTYQTLTSEHAASSLVDEGLRVGCFGVHWYRIILDEAHSIKNRNAKMTKAAYSLKSVYRWCLTGTPMQNNLDELQSLIRFLNIKPYNNLQIWKQHIDDPIKKGKGGMAIKRIQTFLKAFMKRRTKDVLKQDGALNLGKNAEAPNGQDKSKKFQIVGRHVETVVTVLDEDERYYYDRLAARTEKTLQNLNKKDYIGALVLLLRLRQMCNHPGLARGNLKQEEAIVNDGGYGGSAGNVQIAKRLGDSVDDVADLFGELSVKSKKCDTCQTELSRDQSSSGAVRCSECEEDWQAQQAKAKKQQQKGSKRVSGPRESKRKMHTRRIVESDDEDENEGEWLVPESQRNGQNLGKAGGSDDEDAEGGGEWLRSDDEDNTENDDSSVKPGTFATKGPANSKTSAPTMSSNDQKMDNEASDTSNSEVDLSFATNANYEVILCSTKIRRLIQILRSDASKHKFIVFSEFTSMLNLIEPFLAKSNLEFVRYDGKMRNDDREASLAALRTDPKVRILLCSLRCGSLGLNLTAASRVVIFEPFWNPFVEEQAIDRVHRLNQTQDVKVYRLTVANSVEERILELQEKKRELAKAAIEGGQQAGSNNNNLTMKEILHIFKGNAEDHEDEGHSELMSQGAAEMATAKSAAGILSQAGSKNGGFFGSSEPATTASAASGPGFAVAAMGSPSRKQQAKQNSALAQAKAQRERERARNGGALESDIYGRRW